MIPTVLLFFLIINPVFAQEKTDEEFIKMVLEEVQKDWVVYVQDYAEKKNINPDVFPKKLPRKLERIIKNIPVKELRTFGADAPKREQLAQLFNGYLEVQYAVEQGVAPEFYADDTPPTVIDKKDRPTRKLLSRVERVDQINDELPWWKENLMYISMGAGFFLLIIWDRLKKKNS